MFPLLILAAVIMGAAAGGGKRKRKKAAAVAVNFVVLRQMSEYDALVKAGVFTKPVVVVIPYQDESNVTALVRQASLQVPDVLFLVATGEEARSLPAYEPEPEDIVFISSYTVEELGGEDPLSAVYSERTEYDQVWISTSPENLARDLAEAVADARGQMPKAKPTILPQPPQPEPEPEPEPPGVPNPWAPFPDLTEMQEALLLLGFSVGPKGADGAWGSKTKAGVQAFQTHVNEMYGMKLRDDGEPDEPTRAAIGVALDLLSQEKWVVPGEPPPSEPPEPLPPPPSEEPLPPPPGPGEWEPADWDEVSWSDKLFVAPDCSRVVHGNFWSSQRLNPRIIAAAKEGGTVFAEDLLDAELAIDTPFCLDVGYNQWGAAMQGWYDDWTDQIYQDLEIYAANPELLGEG